MQTSSINTFSKPLTLAVDFIAHQEKASGLSTSRFIQDTATNLAPKATFARSKADLAENTFLELSESALVYFAPAVVGEKVARKIFSKNLGEEAKKLVATPAAELLKSKNALNKTVLPVKAAIALTALMIPLTEFCLNYFKNLFTLKLFKKADFENIANLEEKKESTQQQEKLKKSAVKNIAQAGIAFGASLLLAGLMAKRGHKSKLLQNVGEFILAPGSKMFKDSPKKADFFNKYFSIDFASENGKLALSKGQLTACVLIGGLGYFGAAKDRGKQNLLETAFRYPLVGLYVITGSELFEKGFKKGLQKAGKCKDLIGKDLSVPKMSELGDLAKKLAEEKGLNYESELKRLTKQKVLISGVPFLFGIGFMGFFVAGVSNFFTKYRHKQEIQKTKTVNLQHKNLPQVFNKFA